MADKPATNGEKSAPDKNGADTADGKASEAAEAPQAVPSAADKKPDTPPRKKRGRPKGSKNKNAPSKQAPDDGRKTETRRLAKKLEAFLKGPGFAFEAMGEQWPADHVDKAGKNLATALADAAEKNPQLKVRLEMLMEGGQTAQLAVAVIMYVAPLGIYFGMIPAPDRIRLMLQIPYRQGGAPSPDIPPEVMADAEAQATAAGFVDAFGKPDVDGFIRAQMEAAQAVRGPGGAAE